MMKFFVHDYAPWFVSLLLKWKPCLQTAKKEERGQEITESQESQEAVQYIVDETSEVKECDITNKGIEVHVKECDTTDRAIEVYVKECDTKDRATEVHVEDCDDIDRAIEPHPITGKIPCSNEEEEKIENLSAEVEKLKVMLL